MAEYRGSDGAVNIDSTQLGQVVSWEVTTNRPVIDRTVMGDAATERSLDIVEFSGRMRVIFDYGDAKQAALLDQALSGAVPTAFAFEGLLDGAAGTKKLTGNILVTSMPVSGERKGGDFEATVDFVGTGAPAISWA